MGFHSFQIGVDDVEEMRRQREEMRCRGEEATVVLTCSPLKRPFHSGG